MKALNKTIRFSYHLLIAVLLLPVISCSRNNDMTVAPEISHVRLTDPEKADSTFTGAFPGTMVAVIGKNLDGIQKFTSMTSRSHLMQIIVRRQALLFLFRQIFY
ncbi:hypothetical protein KUH03_40000 [Sphingobacterium sp. E70]|uniref:hypothetical protein n=1 Tax=Sphingobacterium sp. E70 TaxID=2853439 RepID=UPI00211BFB51|nr:hypothetical protein [Sphingobacterium sp. E70]ULT24988.1 hypothetical protein KUH03_40000 [Sphingobacterium sp. E70]